MSHPAAPSVLIASLLSTWCSGAFPRPPVASWIPPAIPGLDSSRRPALELLACRLALALSNTPLRRGVDSALTRGTHVAIRFGDLDHHSTAAVASLPIPAHRLAWLLHPAGPRLVAIALDSLPIAFDLGGGKHRLDPTRPPQTPVLVVEFVPTPLLPAIQLNSPALPSPLGARGRVPARRSPPGSISPCQERSP